MRFVPFLLVIASSLLCANALSAQRKTGEPKIGTVIIQEIPVKHYVFGTIETDFKSMGEPVGKALGSLIKTAGDNKLPLVGPVMHYYYGAPHAAPDKGFKMETGFFVQEGSQGPGEYKVRELPKLKCATVLYTGPAPRIGDAWQKVYKAISEQRLTPTGEERELYLYWEGPDSPNNIVQVMVGIK